MKEKTILYIVFLLIYSFSSYGQSYTFYWTGASTSDATDVNIPENWVRYEYVGDDLFGSPIYDNIYNAPSTSDIVEIHTTYIEYFVLDLVVFKISLSTNNNVSNFPILNTVSTYNSVTVDTSASFEMLPTSALTITGNLTNNGTFTIKSNNSGTGSLITNGTISNPGSGNFIVERWIDTSGSKWQLVSSPMDTEKSSVFEGHFLNSYNETTGDFEHIKSTTTNLDAGEGYVVKWKDEFLNATNPIEFKNTIPNTGNYTVQLDSCTWKDPAYPGEANTYFHLPTEFNLVGNPYPSNLSWNDVWTYNQSSNIIQPTFYYYQEGTHGDGSSGNKGGWKFYNANTNSPTVDDPNRFINVGQAFGVLLSDKIGTGSLEIPNSARTHETGNGFNKKLSINKELIELTSSSENGEGVIYLRFNENATSNYDEMYDAYQFNSFGDSPTPYFISSDNKRLALNEMPESESVDLGFNMAVSGEVTFSISNIQDFTEIILEDKQEGTFTDLTKTSYSFNYSDSDSETGRFTLHFKQGTLNEIEIADNISIFSNASTLYLNSDKRLNNVNISVYNISGQEVLSKSFQSLTTEEIYTELKGVYILNLTSDKGNYTTKLILN